GRSPRMRGKRPGADEEHLLLGSIPAYAGETWFKLVDPDELPVDPRVCGGNWSTCSAGAGATGRSPRMRGKLVRDGTNALALRSIPAYAGETLLLLVVALS